MLHKTGKIWQTYPFKFFYSIYSFVFKSGKSPKKQRRKPLIDLVAAVFLPHILQGMLNDLIRTSVNEYVKTATSTTTKVKVTEN